MSPAVKRGLQVAKDLMRRELLQRDDNKVTASQRILPRVHNADLMATLEWIAHQEAIDAKRRRPRC